MPGKQQVSRALRAARAAANIAARDMNDEDWREYQVARHLRGAREKPAALAAKGSDKLPKPGKRVLVIGDSHCEPNQNIRRFRWLARMVADLSPDVVVDIGDWWSMDSLSTYEKPGSKSFEGRRYWQDIDSGVAARELFENTLQKAGRYKIRRIFLEGNHEYRLQKFLDSEPRFEELLSRADFRLDTFGWEFHEYLEPVEVGGVQFVHVFVSPDNSKPVDKGVNLCRMVILKRHCSGVFGHTHKKAYYEESDHSGRKLCVANVGCFFEHSMPWASRDQNASYARGIALLENVRDGEFDFNWWSMERLRRKYGD